MSSLWVVLLVTVSLSLHVSSDFVELHNTKRSNTGASNMNKVRLSPELQMIAQAHAERCENKTNPNLSTLSKTFKDVGENIHFTTIENYNMIKDQGVVNAWSKVFSYHYSSNTCIDVGYCEKFKQVVRAETEFIGCGQAMCGSNVFTVCNYAPRGNPNERPYLRGGICNNCTAGYSCDTDGLCFVPC
uniref:SCP domain-containing protein n=1 Tax=Magallana gigas TaxID=29159 RepID=A0A8W8HNQ0_MAGGI